MSAVLSHAENAMESDPAEAPAAEVPEAVRKSLDLRGHPGQFHDRVVVHRRPSPPDVVALLQDAASSTPRVVSHARAQAARLLRHLGVQPWSIERVESTGGLGSPCRITLKVGAARATLDVRSLPMPHLAAVRY